MKLTIKLKLLMGFAAIILLMVVGDNFQNRSVEHLGNINRKIQLHPLVVTRAIYSLNNNVHLIFEDTIRIIHAKNSEDISYYENKIKKSERGALEQFDIIKRKILGNIGLEAIQGVHRFYQEWSEIREKLITAKRNGDDNALKRLIKENDTYSSGIESKIEALRQYPFAKATYLNIEFENTAERLLFIVNLTQMICVLISVCIALFISTHLGKRINALSIATKKITDGDFQTHVKAEGNDEIASMTRDFNIMVDSLHKTFEMLSENLSISNSSLVNMTTQLSSETEERKKAQNAISESEKFFRGVLEAIHLVAVQLDRNGNILFANDFLLNLTGWERGKIIGKNWFEIFMAPENQKNILTVFRDFLDKSGSVHQHYENSIITRSGDLRDIFWSNMIWRDSTGKAVSVVSLGEDITLRKEMEKEQSRTNRKLINRLVTTIEQAADAVVITDINGNIEYVNSSFEHITGYSRDEIIGKTPRVLKSGKHDNGFYKNMWDTILSGAVWRGQIVNKRKDGELYEEEVSISPITDESGVIVNFAAVKSDITKRRLLEKAQDYFTSITSHELRTPLTKLELVKHLMPKMMQGTINDNEKTVVKATLEDVLERV